MKKNIFSNLTEKILAFVFATALFLYVISLENPQIERIFIIKPDLKNLKPEFTVLSPIPDIKVKIAGYKYIVSSMPSKQIQAWINLKNDVGEQILDVHISYPKEVKLRNFEPDKVKVLIDKIISKKVPVECNVLGATSENYFFDKPQVSPIVVEVKGPSEKINKIVNAVISINVSNLTSSTKTELHPLPVDNRGEVISDVEIYPKKVTLEIKILPLILKEVKVEPQIFGKLPTPYKIKEIIVIPDRVFIKVREDRLSSVSSIKTEMINLADITTDKQMEVSLVKSDSIFYVSQDKVKIEIYIEKIEEEVK